MKHRILTPIALCLVLTACAVISKFDQNSLDATKRIKYEALTLIAHGTEPASQHIQEIATLQSDLAAQIAYEEGKGKANIVTTEQWKIIASPKDLLGKFLKDWSAGKTNSVFFVQEEGRIIGKAFDEVIKLESGKIQ